MPIASSLKTVNNRTRKSEKEKLCLQSKIHTLTRKRKGKQIKLC